MGYQLGDVQVVLLPIVVHVAGWVVAAQLAVALVHHRVCGKISKCEMHLISGGISMSVFVDQ